MRFEIIHGDTLKVTFQAGERLKAESDASVMLHPNLKLAGRMEGGLLSALARKFLTNESFFFQTLNASGPADALLAPVCPGDLIVLDDISRTGTMLMQQGAFLASSDTVEVSTETQRSLVKGFFSGAGFFLLRATGHGPIAFGAYGSVHKVDLKPGEVRIVDNGHVVAWTASMDYQVELAAAESISSSFLSGEGLMCYFTGPGTVYVQSRTPSGLVDWINSMQKNPKRGNGGGGQNGVLPCICFGIIFVLVILMILAIAVFSNDGGVSTERHVRAHWQS